MTMKLLERIQRFAASLMVPMLAVAAMRGLVLIRLKYGKNWINWC